MNTAFLPESPLPRSAVLEQGALGKAAAGLPSLLDLPHRVLTRSGRSALRLALELIGIKSGDRVLMPTYHCPTMIAPVELLGAVPVFYPINRAGQPDLEFLERLGGPPPRALLVAHLFGLPQNLAQVAQLSRSRGIALIEDCAHCFYGSNAGVAVGTTGDYAIASLPKFFPVVEGGMLASASKRLELAPLMPSTLSGELRALWDLVDLASQVGRLGALGALARALTRLRSGTRARAGEGGESAPPADDDSARLAIRHESLTDPLLARAHLRRVEEWIVQHSNAARVVARRHHNYLALAAGLADAPRATVLFPDCGPQSAPYVLPLLVEDADAAYMRMRRARLPVYRWDRIWPGTPRIAGDAAAEWSHGVIQIACHQSLRDVDTLRIVQAIRDCLT